MIYGKMINFIKITLEYKLLYKLTFKFCNNYVK